MKHQGIPNYSSPKEVWTDLKRNCGLPYCLLIKPVLPLITGLYSSTLAVHRLHGGCVALSFELLRSQFESSPHGMTKSLVIACHFAKLPYITPDRSCFWSCKAHWITSLPTSQSAGDTVGEGVWGGVGSSWKHQLLL